MKTAGATPENTQAAAPRDDNPHTAPARLKCKKHWAKRAFDFAAGVGIGVAVNMGVKLTVISMFGSPALAIAAGALAVGAARAGWERYKDVRDFNKINPMNKVAFFDFEKTGHTGKHYMKQAAWATVFSAAGGALGYWASDFFHSAASHAAAPAPDTVVAPAPDANAEALKALQDQVAQLKGEVAAAKDQLLQDHQQIQALSEQVTKGASDLSAVKEQVITLQQEVHEIHQVVVPDHAVPDQVAPDHVVPDQIAPDHVTPDPVPANPDPVQVLPDPVPVHVPTLDERLAQAIAEAKAHLPHKLSRGLADALHRLDSTSTRVQAQAIKDLGYYFSNGFSHVPHDDVLANKLYELSLEVSHGQNAQAAHDLGYHLLYGKGAAVDTDRAYELLSKSSAAGHKISEPMLQYMRVHHLTPRVG